MRKVNYKKAGLYYTIGSFFNKGISFLTVPLFTRLLSTTDYGTVSTYNAWVSMVSVCIGMTLYMAIRQAFIDYPENIDEIHSTITIFITIISSIVLIFCCLICTILSINLLLPLLCIVQSYAAALIEDYSIYLMMKYRYRIRTIFMVFPNLFSVIVASIIIKFILTNRLYLGRIVPSALITFIFGFIVIISVFKKSQCFNKYYLKYSLSISLPLIAHGIALTILGQSDRTMITYFIGANKTGIYSVVYNFSMIATAITSALFGIWNPWYLNRLKSHTKEDFYNINKMSKLYAFLMTIILCEIILISPEFLKLLADEPYWEGVFIIPPIVLSNLVTFIYTFYVDVEHFHKKTKIIALNTFVAAVSNIILNYIFIPIFGYQIAAYTTLISYAWSLFLHYYQARKLETCILKLSVFKKEFLLVILISFIYYLTINNYFIRWNMAIIMAIYLIRYLRINYWYLLKN